MPRRTCPKPRRAASPDPDERRSTGSVAGFHTLRVMPGCPGRGYGRAALLLVAATQVFTVDAGSFLAIVATAAVAGTLSAVIGGRGVFVPVVVVELTLGVVIGPQVLDLAKVNAFTNFF